MPWNNQNGGNGRFGPFSNSQGGGFQSGLTDQPTSPPTPKFSVTPNSTGYGVPDNSTLDFSGYNPNTNSTGYGAADPSTLDFSGYNPTMGMADGGVIPAQGGTVTPDMDTALASVQSALGAGRKAFGLPSDLMGDGGQQDSDGDNDGDQGNSKKQDGSTWQPSQDFVEAAQETPEQQMDKAYIPAVTGIGSGMATALRNSSLPPVPGPAMAQGGVIPSFDDGGDMDAPAAQGMPEQPQDNVPTAQQGQTQSANDPQQALKAYAMGAGAMPSDQALALEQQVDPQGTMDPAQRKLLAVAAAQDPKAQFSLLQHYRQRFQALTSFARAAAEGTQARPANIAASTDAATRAFHNVPNGHSISFAPAGNGKVAVSMSNYAGGGKSKQKSYDDGGDVSVPTGDDLGVIPNAVNGAMSAIGNGASAAFGAASSPSEDTPTDAEGAQSMSDLSSQGDQPAEGVLPTENPLISAARLAGKVVRGVQGAEEGAKGAVNQKIMSISDYLNALKNSMYDAYLGKTEPDKVLQKAASGGGGGGGGDNDQTPAPAVPQTAPQGGPAGAAAPTAYGNTDQDPGSSTAEDQANRDVTPFGNSPDEISVLPEHPTRAQIDAFNASNGSFKDRSARNMGPIKVFNPFGGNDLSSQEKMEVAMNQDAGSQEHSSTPGKYGTATTSKKTKPAFSFGTGRAGIQGQTTRDVWGQKEGAINGRNAATNQTRMQIAQMQAIERAWASGQHDFTSLVNSQRNAPGGASLTPEALADMALKTIRNGGPIPMPSLQPAAAPQQSAPQQSGQPAAPAPITGPIAVNPQTGQRMTVRNGQWVPIPAGQ